MSETVYIETSIIGYLTARPSNNLILMANLEFTRQWWETRRAQFTLYISQVVLDEVARGDAEILRDFSLLEISKAVQNLAAKFLTRSNLPPKAADDALQLHITAATVYGLDYLLTWCRHIANAQIQKKLSQSCLLSNQDGNIIRAVIWVNIALDVQITRRRNEVCCTSFNLHTPAIKEYTRNNRKLKLSHQSH